LSSSSSTSSLSHPPPSRLTLPSKPPQLLQVKKAIEKGNIDGAKIYAQNAIRKKTEALNYLRLASRLDAVVSRLETQAKMQGVARSMGGIVKALDRALAANNVEKVAETMDAFERQFEDLDVQSQVMEGAMTAQASLATPEEDVATLLQQVADEHGLEVQLNLPQAGAQVRSSGGGVLVRWLFFWSFFLSFFPLTSLLPLLSRKKNEKPKTQVAAPPQAAPQSTEPDLSERLAQLRGGAAK
jgi:charged multivesicular body protein 1